MKIISSDLVKNKKVLIRIDTDVPLEKGQIKDPTRLKAILPTLQLLKQSAAQIIIIGHLGRPEGKQNPTLSLKPICTVLSEELDYPIEFVSDLQKTLNNQTLPLAPIVMLENLRFEPGEEANDPEFARKLASLADIFIFEAFAVSHRKAASTTAVAEYLPSYAGLRVAKEVAELSTVLQDPDHPFLVIIGGAKIETKLPVINNMLDKADKIFVGGKLPYEIKQNNMTFPEKVVVAHMNESGFDISSEMYPQITELISKAKMIVWNGPVGKFEDETQCQGTKIIAEAIASSSAKTIIGGGETNEAASLFGIENQLYFISVGGGAMLEFLSGKKLPALAALE